ncbi:glycerophosphodiester phosphodiesterase [Kitasatospora sp. NPDC059571]|uniref:glycerophosphodiester phosphodiesterase n=1 Tax=Kitasatospora sp. NPDC059571 TaxID=3346871 RepID=UPI0036A86311
MSRPLAVAHRGDPYRHRENTLPSIASALAAGADAVEVDVRLTRDGVPVLLHDPTLERLWGDPREVRRLTLDRLADIGGPGQRVPTLAEALKAVADLPGARLLIDLDLPDPAAAVRRTVADLGAERLVAYCGPATAMLAVRAEDPDAEISLTWRQPRLPAAPLLADLRPRYLNPPFGLAGPALVGAAHDAGLLVAVWTVDRRRTMRRMIAAGADSLTTNRIDLLRRTVDAAAAARPAERV